MKKEVVKLDAVLADDDKYGEALERYKSECLGWPSGRSRELEVRVEGKAVRMTVGALLVNLHLLRAFNLFKSPVPKEFVYSKPYIDGKSLTAHFDAIIQKFKDENDDYEALSKSIAKSIRDLSELSGKVNAMVGNTVSLYDLARTCRENPEVKDLVNTNIPENLEFHEIETYVSERTSRLVELLKADKKSVFSGPLNSKTGINLQQFAQMFVSLGLKSDLYGNIIPEVVNTNLLRGFRNVRDYYINSLSARKALILSHGNVRESGYLTRKLSLLVIDSGMDYSLESCDSRHHLRFTVDSEKTLARLEGRVMVVDGKSVPVDVSDASLIGKEISLKSPVTCNGPKVCRECYGPDLAKLNQKVHCGILAVLILTNMLTQRLLSAKHLLSTKSKKTKWPEGFKRLFVINKNSISPAEGVPEGSRLIFRLSKEETDSKESVYKVNKWRVVGPGENDSMLVKLDLSFMPTPEFLAGLPTEKGKFRPKYSVPLSSLKPGVPIFWMNTENTELSLILKKILKLIESKDHLEAGDDIAAVYLKFIQLLNDSGLGINSVHVEMILRELVRDVSKPNHRPDFSSKKPPEYRVLRVTDAVIRSPSVSVGLVFERIKAQLVDLDTYKKDTYSIVDELIDI